LGRLAMDKKKEGNELPFILLKKIGIPFMSKDVGLSLPKKILEEMTA